MTHAKCKRRPTKAKRPKATRRPAAADNRPNKQRNAI